MSNHFRSCCPSLYSLTPFTLAFLAVDDLTEASSDYVPNSWVTWFLATKGNEYFCEVDEDYILDRFNLTGLNAEVQHYPQALDLITDSLEDDLSDSIRDSVEAQAKLLYGLVHARYIITTRGLGKMLEKYKRADLAAAHACSAGNSLCCPSASATIPSKGRQALLPALRRHLLAQEQQARHHRRRLLRKHLPAHALHGLPHRHPLQVPHRPLALSPQRLPTTSRRRTRAGRTRRRRRFHHVGPGGAGNGSSLPAGAVPSSSAAAAAAGSAAAGGASTNATPANSTAAAAAKVERYRPRIFGFPVHETSKLQKWQDKVRDQQIERLEKVEAAGGIATPGAAAFFRKVAPAPAAPAAAGRQRRQRQERQ